MTKSKAILWGLIGCYGGLFSFISILKYFSYSFHDFDLAIYAQGLWNLLHGSLESSILGIPLFGNHFVPILFLILPLYAIFPTPLLLLILQTSLLGGGAFFVYRIAQRKLPEPLPLGLAFSYLLYPALGYTNLFEFHPVALAVFFLLGALDAFDRAQPWRFFFFATLACLCQEDVPLAMPMMGLYALFQKRAWPWILLPMVFGGGFFVLVVFKVMPSLNPGIVDFSLLYSHLGETLPEIFSYILTHPLKTVALLFEGPEKKIFVASLLGPLFLLPLFDPKSFLMAVPFFMEQLLSRRPTQHLLNFHYGALFIPFLYYAAIQGAVRILRWRKIRFSSQALFLLVFFATLAMNVWAGPHFHMGELFSESRRDLLDEKRDFLLQKIPKEAAVMATFEFLPHLTRRRELYAFHHVYTQKYTLSGKPYSMPEGIQYLLVDFNDPLTHGVFYFATDQGDRYAREFLESGPFRVLWAFQDLVLFEKGEGERLFRVEKTGKIPPLSAKDPEGKIGLSRFFLSKRKLSSGEPLLLTFDWICLEASSRRYGLLFEMVDEQQKRIRRQYHSLCYRLYPTERWKKGEKIIEQYRLVFPPTKKEKKRTWTVTLHLMDEKSGERLSTFVHLGDFEVLGETL